MGQRRFDRRSFLRAGAATGAALGLGLRPARALASPNERLDLGIIGVANRGGDNLAGVASENIVALCDVDKNYLAAAAQQFPRAALYTDWRHMLDEQRLDGVVISTPDHLHAIATSHALDRGLHVYCEKPLTHTVEEARVVAQLAKQKQRVTQMGTQIHAEANYRRVVELVRAQAIGPIREVHVWCGKTWSAAALPTSFAPAPDSLRWDLWLGPAQPIDYSPEFHPASWRRYWRFGGGTLADMACHHMDLSFWALELRHPTHVEAKGPAANAEAAPLALTVEYQFPARGAKPPVKLTWYDGGPRPQELLDELGFGAWGDGTLFVGEKGYLVADYSNHGLAPATDFEGFTPPPTTIPASLGHHREWIVACKTGAATTCDFGYSGALTEAVLLGSASHRAGVGFDWDGAELRAAGSADVERFLRKEYPAGFELVRSS